MCGDLMQDRAASQYTRKAALSFIDCTTPTKEAPAASQSKSDTGLSVIDGDDVADIDLADIVTGRTEIEVDHARLIILTQHDFVREDVCTSPIAIAISCEEQKAMFTLRNASHGDLGFE
jgi:hypothetical protein